MLPCGRTFDAHHCAKASGARLASATGQRAPTASATTVATPRNSSAAARAPSAQHEMRRDHRERRVPSGADPARRERPPRPSATPNASAGGDSGCVCACGSAASAPHSAASAASSGTASCACTRRPTQPSSSSMRGGGARALDLVRHDPVARRAVDEPEGGEHESAAREARAGVELDQRTGARWPKASADPVVQRRIVEPEPAGSRAARRSSPLIAMSCTMPMPMASCVFHSSWPARPGRTNASAMSASAVGGSGSRSGGKARPGQHRPRRPTSCPRVSWCSGA